MLVDFVYYAPTRVVFGKNAEVQTAEQIRQSGGSKVLIHYGGRSAEKSGLLERIESYLSEAGIESVKLGGVVPNPRLSLVREGIRLCKEEGVDFVLAVGGGSVIDSCKAICYGLANDGDVWDFYTGKRVPEKFFPLGVVLTLSAAGSEMSNSSVITNEEGWLKRGCNSNLCRPTFAICDPVLTMTLPPYQTACGCTDIMMHTMERYFHASDSMMITDEIAEGLLRTVKKNALILRENPMDYNARAEIMWAGSLSHNGLTGLGSDNGSWACHKLEHEMGGLFDVAHGAGLAAIWGSWARFVYRLKPDRFARFAVNVMAVEPGENDEVTALRGIEAMEEFYRAIGMPVNMKELGIEPTDAQIEEMAEKCMEGLHYKGVGSIEHLEKDGMIEIYMAARA